ncbi:Uncharacterised protein [uncultured archaeon]|nr:Uncharacterised protein [uncultured archaeon]
MDFIDSIRDLSSRIQKQVSIIQTEEATKTAFVMPFIGALGYNVFDPSEVTPELIADVGTKKGEKVDYAILINGKPTILFECKWCGGDLDKDHASQLFRYFNATGSRFGVLTNGIIYRFYSDLEKPNVMDEKPFLEFNMLDIKEPLVEELKKFSKSSFDLDSILDRALELKYMREMRRIIEEQINNPSEDFVRFFASQVYPARLTPSVKEQFTQITKNTFKQFINDKINERLNLALASETLHVDEKLQPEASVAESQLELEAAETDKIVTTNEELEGYFIVKTTLREIVDSKRVNIRDTVRYCGILFNGSSRTPIARLYFNEPQKYIGIFNDSKQEEKIPIATVDDIYKYVDKLKSIALYYNTQKGQDLTGKSLSSFTFKGKKYETKYWKDMLLQISKIMAELHADRFDSVLTLVGRQRPFFSKNPGDLRSPEQIEGTDIFAEVNLSSYSAVKLSKNVLSLFGYPESDLSMEMQ